MPQLPTDAQDTPVTSEIPPVSGDPVRKIGYELVTTIRLNRFFKFR